MDFKNSDIVNGTTFADLGSPDAAVALEAAATIAIAMQAGNILPLTADGQLVLPAGVGLDDIKVVGRDLVIQMPDGTQMIVPDGAVFVPQIVVDGVAVPPLNIAALLIGQEPVPEAGRPQSSGGNFSDAVGDIGDPFGLGDLLPPTQLAFPEPEEREIIPQFNDEEPTTIIITPDQPAGSVNATASVQEAALPARGSESPGSNPASTAETTAGTIVFDAPDGLGSITLNGIAVASVGQTFVTPLGTLTITSIAPGNIGYSYTLTDNTTAPSSNDVFAVVVTDSDGDAASANLTINIVDDAPTARNDTDSVVAGTYSPQTGNVVTGAGTTSGDAGADTQGADGAVVSGARAGTGAGTFVGVGTTIDGQYGTLAIAADGSYTYTRNAGTPGGVNDVFTYQITDGDGDTSTATLTIEIGDAPPAVTQVPTTGEGTVVNESGLPARGDEPPGSNAPAPSESSSGTITFTPGDAPATVSINNTIITGPGQVITVPTGTLTITSYDPSGTIGYTFTLGDNTAGDTTSQVFTVTVTDADGDTDTEPFTITIVDDVPTARNDSATQGAENTPVVVNVIVNDTTGADGVSLASGVALVAGSLSGTGSLAYNGNGTFTYTPAPGEEGIVTFQYTITDGDGDPSTATVTITLAEDSQPAVEVGGDRLVNEAGLPARGDEPQGSGEEAAAGANGDASETTSGTIATSTGNDTVGSLFVGGVDVTNGGSITTAKGVLTVTLSDGNYTYSYTLTDNTSGDTTTDSFSVLLTDSDGDTASDTLVIDIADDAPIARDDTDAVPSGSYGPETGNVLSGEGTTSGAAGADTSGADGITVTAISGVESNGAPGDEIFGNYGTLVMQSDGSYSYVRFAGTPGDVTDIFTYTITDGDGDPASATLEISIRDSGTTLDVPVSGEAGTAVSELGLPARMGESQGSGEEAAAGANGDSSEATSGTITFTAPDGPATVTIQGKDGPVVITAAGQAVAGLSGVLTVDSFNAATGTITYTYALGDNTSGDATSETFIVKVADADDDSTTLNLVIAITDDVPMALNDGATQSLENSPVTIDVLSNDVEGADSVAPSAVSAVAGSLTGLGSLVYNNDGTFTYTPAAGEVGTVSFDYQIVDGDGDPSVATATITLVADSEPQIIATNAVVDEDGLKGANVDATPLQTTPAETDSTESASGSSTVTVDFGSDRPDAADWLSSFNFIDSALLDAQVKTLDGNAVTFAIEGEALVGRDSGGELVMTITATTAVANGATGVTYSIVTELFQPVQHTNDESENSVFLNGVGFEVTDSDGTTNDGSFSVEIVDDVPTAVADMGRTVVEGAAAINGNVLANDQQGADGATLTHVNVGSGMVAITSGTPVGDAFSFAVAGKGTYTFKADGSWTFAPLGNLNNASGTNAGFTYTLTDADKDMSVATQPITIEDGANPTSSKNATITVNEEGLANANATGSVNNNSENGGDTVTFNAGSDNIVSVAFGDTTGITVNVDGVDGADIVWTAVGTTQIEGRIGGVLAITLTLVPPALPILAGGSASATVNVALTDNFPHPNANGENMISLTGISVVATDTDNDTATATVAVTVIDDIARADDDAVGLTEGGPSFVNFDVDTNDVAGADGTGSRVFTSLTGTYGNITLNGDGTQTYTLTTAGQLAIDALPPGATLTDTFGYTLTDGDGDSDPAQLVVTLTGTDDPVTITNLTPKANGGDAVVDEDDLPAGSDTAKESLTTTGDFTISAPDGVASLTVGGVLVVSNGVFTAPAPLVTPLGNTLTFTGYNAATGVVSYTYTLNAAETHPNANGENNLFEDFPVVLTDADPVNPDVANSTLSIQVIDDVPTAVNDTAQSVAEDGANIGGNVRTNDTQGADGATVTHIDLGSGFVAISDGVNLGGGVFQHSTANGVYTIMATGAWTFNPNTNLNNASGISASFSYRLTDADGDISEAVQPITVTDGAVPQATKNASIIVNEEGLANGNAAGSVNNNSENGSDTVTFQAGSDNITTIAFGDVTNLTADVNGVVGNDISWTRVSATQITGSIGGVLAITINLVPPVLPILAGASGSATVNVILSDNFPHPNGSGENTISLTGLNVVATDTDGDPASATVSVTVIDDVPTARADQDSINEDDVSATGNVISGVGTTNSPGSADTQGADGAAVSGVAFGNVAGPVAGSVGAPISGEYGSLTLLAGGGYTYTLDNSDPVVQALGVGSPALIETFTYTITDGDGDTSTTTLTIRINGTNDLPTFDPVIASVSEEGLPNPNPDTNPVPDDTTDDTVATGSINLNDIDGSDALTVTLGTPSGALQADGVAIVWTASADNKTLTGTAGPGGAQIIIIEIDNDGNYRVDLLQPIDHLTANGENVATFTIPVSVFDGTATVTNPTGITVRVEDDSPVIFDPADASVNNTNIAPTAFALNYQDAVGADGLGNVVFNIVNGSAAVDSSGNALKFNGEALFIFGNGTNVLTARTSVADGSDVAYTITIVPGSDQYILDVNGTISNGTEFSINNLTSSAAGNVDFRGIGVGDPASVLDVILSGRSSGGAVGSVNTDSDSIGIDNQSVGAGEAVRIDFVSNLQAAATTSGFSFSNHTTVTTFQQFIPQVQGAQSNTSSIRVSAILADNDQVFDNTPATPEAGESLAIITSVRVQDFSTGTWFTFVSGSPAQAGASVTFNADGSVSISGLQQGDRYEINTSSAFSAVVVEGNPGTTEFDLGVFSVVTINTATPIMFDYDVTGTDADGDSIFVPDAIKVTLNPVTPPIVLDLDGDGPEFLSASSGVAFDYNGDGAAEQTAWVGADDGLLAIDRNGDGIVNDGSEIVFASGNLTDLQGLAADYDSNDDGVLTVADDSYALFGVWQDANGNGVTDAGEFQSLTDAGIVSVGLVSDGIGYSAANGDVSVAGQALYTKADGSTGIVADAAFATTAAQAASRSSDQLRTSNVTSSVVAASLVGLASEATPAFVDLVAIEGTQMVQFDYQPFVSNFEPFNMASVQQDFARTSFAPSQDFVQRIGEVATSLRAMDEADVGFSIQDSAVRQMSGLLGDSASPVNSSSHGLMQAFGGDMVMHHVLDMATLAAPAGANDNPAIPTDAVNVIRNAMPDIMMDRLVDSFSGDVGASDDSIVADVAGADALHGVLDQIIDTAHFSGVSNTDLLGSQQYEMATSTN
jgi:VCBS repeat-containing protein